MTVEKIQPTNQPFFETTTDTSTRLLAKLVVGQKVQAIVIASVLAAEIATVKVADSLLKISTSVSLQQGQAVQIELVQVEGKLVLKLVVAEDIKLAIPRSDVPLKAGQVLAVEVVKQLANNRLLVTINNTAEIKQQNFPRQLDIDISHLNRKFIAGEKLFVGVIKTAPLTIQLSSADPARSQLLLEQIRQVLPQQLSVNNIFNATKAEQLSISVQQEVQTLFKHILDKPQLTELGVFKRALSHAGPFLEHKLLTQPTTVNQDFKANLLRLISVLETAINLRAFGGQQRLTLAERVSFIQSILPKDSTFLSQLATSLLADSESAQKALPATGLPRALATSLVQIFNKLNMSVEQGGRLFNIELSVLRELLKEVEGVHSKLLLNQLAMVKEPDSSTSPTVWLFDVPIKDKTGLEMMQLRIEQHKKQHQSEDQNDIWQVQLTLDTQNLGPVKATVTMHNEDVNVMIYAERSESAVLLETHLELLTIALNKLDINLNHISCRCGEIIPATSVDRYIAQSDALVDISV
ncbi:MAG: hypothetical protein COB23_02535 [Methylophaga sp.]|nr:MAG: hypothetical protein COB23_02535 [Methylophaga sp.]